MHGSDGKESACNAGDLSSIPELGRSPGGRHGNPLQYSCFGKSLWTEEPGRLESVKLQRVRHDQTTKHIPALNKVLQSNFFEVKLI